MAILGMVGHRGNQIFIAVDSLRIDVHRDRDICMAQQLLHGLDVLTVCLEQSGKSAPESVPADLAGNAGGLCSGLKMRPIQSAWPVRLFHVLGRTGKDPVLDTLTRNVFPLILSFMVNSH